MSKPNDASNTTTSDQPRLPCRGCMADCPNYHRCDGKPWRAQDTEKQD